MSAGDARWMGAAAGLGERAVGRSTPNPPVGCVVVAEGIVAGRGWTQPGGRPHAEAMALAHAGARAKGATAYVTLEPCAHVSARGPACADLLIAAGVARVVVAYIDPDPRTAGQGIKRLRAAGIDVAVGPGADLAEGALAGFLTRHALARPHVTLKLALSIDGALAMADGRSKWITGDLARASGHMERARADLIVVGRGTRDADAPGLDVRLPGLEDRSPAMAVLSRSLASHPTALILRSPADIDALAGVLRVLVEGGAGTAAAFLAADRVDRVLIHRAPIIIGGGRAGVGDLGLRDLADAHGRWRRVVSRALGPDRLETYARTR